MQDDWLILNKTYCEFWSCDDVSTASTGRKAFHKNRGLFNC